MTTTPSGAPAWVRTNTHEEYGGHLDKVNYQNQPAVNARTDLGAESLTRMAADLAMLARTAPFSIVTFTCDDSGTGAPVVSAVNQMTGIRSTSYVGDAAPTGFPSGARNGNGDVTFTWAASYLDPYSVSGAVSIKHATVEVHGTTAAIKTVTITATTVRVRLFNDAGAALSNAKATLKVYT